MRKWKSILKYGHCLTIYNDGLNQKYDYPLNINKSKELVGNENLNDSIIYQLKN